MMPEATSSLAAMRPTGDTDEPAQSGTMTGEAVPDRHDTAVLTQGVRVTDDLRP